MKYMSLYYMLYDVWFKILIYVYIDFIMAINTLLILIIWILFFNVKCKCM